LWKGERSNIVGAYVACVYDRRWYLSVVTTIDSLGDVGVKFMHPPGPATSFHWPSKIDSCKLPEKDILGQLRDVPVPTTNRATRFVIEEQMMDAIDAKFARFLAEL
jgi:hypothetical protein